MHPSHSARNDIEQYLISASYLSPSIFNRDVGRIYTETYRIISGCQQRMRSYIVLGRKNISESYNKP